MKRTRLLAAAALVPLTWAVPLHAQDLQDRPVDPPPPSSAVPADAQQIQFSADTLSYDTNADVVSAEGEVFLLREGNRVRADRVVWNRKTGRVTATGNVAVTNAQGDTAYGDSVELTDSLKGGVVDNMLVVLNEGGRLAAKQGTRADGGVITLRDAAYTPCDVTRSSGCPKEPTWKITAVRVVYDPQRERIRYNGARISVFGISTPPLPVFSHPVGGGPQSGFLDPDLRYSGINGFQIAAPYYLRLAPNRGLIVEPYIFSNALPMLAVKYTALNELGAFSIAGYGTYSRRSDDVLPTGSTDTLPSKVAFRGYLDGTGRYQLDPNWSLSGSLRLTTDKTFLRRYDLSRDDRLRTTAKLERIDENSYLSLAGWYVQTLRLGENQLAQPIALPEFDYRRRLPGVLFGGTVQFEANTLAIARTEGQDSQRAFASARWDLRRITPWGQEVTFTAFGRGDIYHTVSADLTTVADYRGENGFQTRAIGALAVDVKWPFIGALFGGSQRFTPRVQIVASPTTPNLIVPNEDARAVDLEDSNLFALNRFPGYDRWEDGTRITYGAEWALDLPNLSIDAVIGQSYRFSGNDNVFPHGTGLDDRVSDIVGRTVVRYKDFVSLTHRYRLDKDGLAVRRNEIDATIGSRVTYAEFGYLRLNRNITPTLEDLQDREELRAGGRVQVSRYVSLFGSTVIDLTDRSEDPQSLATGFDPVRHRVGVAYEDDCLRLGVTWQRFYQDTGDARRGNSYLLTLALKNLGR